MKRPLLSLSLSLHRNHASNPRATFLKVENGRIFLSLGARSEQSDHGTGYFSSYGHVYGRLLFRFGLVSLIFSIRKQNIFLTFLPLCINRYQTRFTTRRKMRLQRRRRFRLARPFETITITPILSHRQSRRRGVVFIPNRALRRRHHQSRR